MNPRDAQFSRRTLMIGTAHAALGLVTLSACGNGMPQVGAIDEETSNKPDPPARQGGTLRVAHPTSPTTLDPATGNSGYDHIYLYTMFDTLVDYVPETLQARPGLATKWEYPDPSTLVLTLREGVTFHDGTPFDAEAVKYNFERSITWEHSNIAGDLVTVDTVEVVDPLTVKVNLKEPDTSLPLILSDRAGMMVSPTAAEAGGQDFGRQPVGTGAFAFGQWRTGDAVVVNRNDKYWGKKPTLDHIDFSIVSDPETALNGVLSGEQDFTFQVDPMDLSRVQDENGIEVSLSSNLFHYEFYVNRSRPPFDDVRVRQAFNLAIDRKELLYACQLGTGEVAWGPMPSTHWAFAKDQVPTYPHDPERAKELLAEAGYEDGLTFEIVGWTEDIDIRRAEVIQAQLAEVGMKMEIRSAEVPQATATFFDENRYDAYLASWTGRPDPTLTYTLLFSKDGYFNAGGVETPGVEELLLATRVDTDIDERAKAFAELNELVIDQALYVPLMYPPDSAVYRTNVVNYTPNMLGKPKFAHVGLAK